MSLKPIDYKGKAMKTRKTETVNAVETETVNAVETETVNIQVARCRGSIFAAGKGTVRLSIAAGRAIESFREANQVVVNGKRKPLTDRQLAEVLSIDDSTLSRHSRVYRASLIAPTIRHMTSANTAHTLAQVILHKAMSKHTDLCRMLIERNL